MRYFFGITCGSAHSDRHIYILLDFLYFTFILHSPFMFDAKSIIMPVTLWTVMKIVSFLSRKLKKDKDI